MSCTPSNIVTHDWEGFGNFVLPRNTGLHSFPLTEFFDNSAEPGCLLNNSTCDIKEKGTCDCDIDDTSCAECKISWNSDQISFSIDSDNTQCTSLRVCVTCHSQSTRINRLKVVDVDFQPRWPYTYFHKVHTYGANKSPDEAVDNWGNIINANAAVLNRNVHCQLLESGCGSPFSYTNHVNIPRTTNDYTIQMVRDEPNGYVHHICIKCQFQTQTPQGTKSLVAQETVQYDNWSVFQKADPSIADDCSQALTSVDWVSQGNFCYLYQDSPAIINPNGISDIYSYNSSTTSTNCPINLCKLYRNSGCTGAGWNGDVLRIENGNSDDWKITFDPSESWDRTWCVECYVGNGGDEFTNSISKHWVEEDFITRESYSDKSDDYNSNASEQEETDSYQKFFRNDLDNSASCTPQCQIFEDNCSSATAPNSSHIFMEPNYPFEVKYFTNIRSGYSYNLCVQCTYESYTPPNPSNPSGSLIYQHQKQDQWMFTLNPDPTYCDGILTKHASNWTATDTIYLNNEVQDTILAPDGWHNFFANADATNCPVTSCELKYSTDGSTCTDPLDTQYGEIGTVSPWVVTAHQQASTNLGHPWCVTCTTQGGFEHDSVIGKVETHNILMSVRSPPFADVSLLIDTADSSAHSIATNYLAFFQNSCSTCLPQRCSLFEIDGSNACTSTPLVTAIGGGSENIVITNSGGYMGLSAYVNHAAGWDYEFCYQCEYDTTVTDDSSNTHVLQTQIVQDVVKVSLQALDCSNTLTDPSQPADVILTYQASTYSYLNPNPSEPPSSPNVKWNNYFQNTQDTLCQISSCDLFDSTTCSTPASGNIEIEMSGMIKVKAFQGVVAGYEETYCIKCVNALNHDSAQFIWTIKQTKSLCYGVFNVPTTNPTTTIDFNQDSSWFQILPDPSFTSWDQFANNQQSSACQVTFCQLYNQGFGSLYSNSSRMNFLGSKGLLFVKRNLKSFTETVGVFCSNGISTFNFDNWKVQLIGCENSMASPADPPTSKVFSQQLLGHSLIYPDASNSTWENYFSIGNPQCEIDKCILYNSLNGDPDFGTLNHCANENGACTCPKGSFIFFGQYSGILQINRQLNTSMPYVSKISNATITACDQATFGDPAPGQTKNCFCQTGLQIGNGNIQIATNNPYQLTALLNQSQGYLETFGVACKNIADQWAFSGLWNVTLCGVENVLLTGNNYFAPPFSLNSAQNTITLQDYQGFFQSSNPDCPIVSYKLMDLDGTGGYQSSQSTSIVMNPDFSIQIDTSQQLEETIYIEASTLNQKVGYLELRIFLTNLPPTFEEGPLQKQEILISPSQSQAFKIPSFSDQESLNQEDIIVSVSNLDESFMTFDEETMQISFAQMSEANAGNYTVTITLQDLQGKVSSYDVEFQFINPIVEEEQEVVETVISTQYVSDFVPIHQIQEEIKSEPVVFKFQEQEQSNEICKASIIDIGFFGQVKIHFSQYMSTDFDLALINENALDIYVKPAEERHLKSSEGNQFNMSSLNLTWVPHSFKNKDLVLNVTFNNPRAISPLTEQDKLVIFFKNLTLLDSLQQRQLFFAKEIHKPIDDKYRLLQRKIKRQMEDSDASRNFAKSTETSKNGLLVAMGLTMVLQLFMAGAMSFMIGWINTLQIIIHLPMIKILIPSNVSVFFQTIIPVVTFDIIPPEWSTEHIMEFEEFPDETFTERFNNKFFGQMQDLGYDSHNTVQILGSLWVFSAFYFFRLLIFLPVVKLLSRYFTKLQNYSKTLYEQLVIGEIVLISLEAYYEFLIGGYINVLFQLDNKSGEKVGVYSAYYSLVVSVIILPLFMVFLLTQKVDKLQEHSFEKMWGALYEGISVKSKWQVACNLVFMMRRMFFVSMCFNLEHIPGIQMILVNLSNLFCGVYYGYFKPYETRFQNRVHYFNEFLITVVTWHMMLFTEYVPDQDKQFLIGWSMIISIMFNALINIIVILGIVGKQLFLIILKGSRVVDLKFDRFCLRMLQWRKPQVPSANTDAESVATDCSRLQLNNMHKIRKINPNLIKADADRYQEEATFGLSDHQYVPKKRYLRDQHPYVLEQRRYKRQFLIATNAINDEDYVKKKRYNRNEYLNNQQLNPIRHMTKLQNYLNEAKEDENYVKKKRYVRDESPYVIKARKTFQDRPSAFENMCYTEETPYVKKQRYKNPKRVQQRLRRQSEFTFNDMSIDNTQQ